MVFMADTITVRLIAVHMCCDLCGATGRIPAPENSWDEQADWFRRWLSSHYRARLLCAEVAIGGRVRVVQALVPR